MNIRATIDLRRRQTLRAALASVVAAAPMLSLWSASGAQAADFPGSKPIRLVVPFPPGGGTDIVGRTLAHGLAQELKATVIVENLPGATGTMGSARVARAEPDGYTLLLGISATHAIAPALMKDVSYKPDRDFTALARVGQGGNLIVVHPSLPVKNIAELIELARKPGSDLSYGSWGIGSGGHLAMEAVNQQFKTQMQHVPYKGVAPLLQDLIGGNIKVAVVDLASGPPQVRSGKLRPIAVTGAKRATPLPEVPTLVEQGGNFDTMSWYGVFGPAKMPAPLVEQLSAAFTNVLKQPEVAEKVRSLGMDPEPVSREAFQQQVGKEMAVWARIVQVGGIKAE